MSTIMITEPNSDEHINILSTQIFFHLDFAAVGGQFAEILERKSTSNCKNEEDMSAGHPTLTSCNVQVATSRRLAVSAVYSINVFKVLVFTH